MRKPFMYIIVALFVLAACNQKEEQVRMPKQYTIEQLYNNVAVGAAGFNADETKILVDNNSTGIFNVYELSIGDTTGNLSAKHWYEEMGDPDTADNVLLKNTSPLFHYQQIHKPLIVFQGANDVRVLKVESDAIVEGVKKNGVPVEYVVYPDEGHGFIKKENQIGYIKTNTGIRG